MVFRLDLEPGERLVRKQPVQFHKGARLADCVIYVTNRRLVIEPRLLAFFRHRESHRLQTIESVTPFREFLFRHTGVLIRFKNGSEARLSVDARRDRLILDMSTAISERHTERMSAHDDKAKPGSGTRHSVFLCYRREDSAGVAGRIYDRLVSEFGQEAIFKDVDSIPGGRDYRKHIGSVLTGCRVFLVVIGTKWLTAQGPQGKRRIDDPSDLVRIEVESAISYAQIMIPLLVEDARLPQADEVPLSVRELVYRQSREIRHDPDFHRDMDRLVAELRGQRGDAD